MPEIAAEPTRAPRADVPALDARAYLPDGCAVWAGDRFTLLRDGVEAYPAMLEAIRGARHDVLLETYMFIDDAVGRMFGRALVEAAARGVDVKVLYDALGSWGARRRFFRELRAQGVNVHSFRPFSWRRLARLVRRDHRKLLVVDEAVAFVGGVNIASHWAPKGEGDGWRDDVVAIRGPMVGQLRRRFAASWRAESQRGWMRALNPHRARGSARGVGGGASFLSSRRGIHQAYVHAIQHAQRSVLLSAAYFNPDRRMLAALEGAARRGVEVCLILAGRTDHRLVQLAGQALYERLLKWGVRLYEWHEGVLHAKTAVVDGVWATVGSFNLERMSLRLNYELNVVCADESLASALEERLRGDLARCRVVSAAAWHRRPLWRKALERLAWALRKLL